MPRRVERIELDDPIGGEGEHGSGRWPWPPARSAGAPPRWRCDRASSSAAVFLDGARRIAELLGEAAHDRVRTVGADRHRHERRGLLERLERRLVALLGERRAESELRAIAARPIAPPRPSAPRCRRRALLAGLRGLAVSRSAARTAPKRWSSILSNVPCSSSMEMPRPLLIAASPSMPSPYTRTSVRSAASPRVATMCSTSSDAW